MLGKLTALTFLDLRLNQLSGSIPNELGKLTALTSLYLRGNQLSGPIPNALRTITALRFFFLDLNQQSDFRRKVPKSEISGSSTGKTEPTSGENKPKHATMGAEEVETYGLRQPMSAEEVEKYALLQPISAGKVERYGLIQQMSAEEVEKYRTLEGYKPESTAINTDESINDDEFLSNRGNFVLHAGDTGINGDFQRLRDGFGYVEVRVLGEEAKQMENVKLLDQIYVQDVKISGNLVSCEIDRIVRGPSGTQFSGATISYFLGRWTDFVSADDPISAMEHEAEKVAIGSLACDAFVPTIKNVEDTNHPWGKEGDFKAIWRDHELWLETALDHFSDRGFAKITHLWSWFKRRIRKCNEGTDRASTQEAPFGQATATTSPILRTIESCALPPQPDSSRMAMGARQVCFENATEEDLEVYVVPHSFRTAEEVGYSREVEANAQFANMAGAGVRHSAQSNRSHAQEYAHHGVTAGHYLVAPTQKLYKELPGYGDATIIWFSVNYLTTNEVISEQVPNVTENIKQNGYDIDTKENIFTEKVSSATYKVLKLLRVWGKETLRPRYRSIVFQERLNRRPLYEFIFPFGPKTTEETIIRTKVLHFQEAPQG